MSTIFSTIHGSRLYGVDHAGSDHDTFTVVTNDHDFGDKPTRQVVRGFGDQVTDDITFTFSEFMQRVNKGSHQALEAIFSPVKEWGTKDQYSAFVESYHATSPDVFYAYERTIRKFAFGDFKRRRHGVRLAQNLKALREFGRFNPRMTVARIQEANEMATSLSGNALLRELDIPTSDDYAESHTNKEG